MTEFLCPYCEEDIEEPEECYNTEKTYNEQCPYCKKNFVFTVELCLEYQTSPADCLNGGDHDYRKTKGTGGLHEYAISICNICKQEKTCT